MINVLKEIRPHEVYNLAAQSFVQTSPVVGEPTMGFVLLNTAKPPTDDLRVRTALAKATDQEAVQKVFGDGTVQTVDGLFLPDSPFYGPTGYPGPDPAGARALVKAYAADKGTPTVQLSTTPDPRTIQLVQVIQDKQLVVCQVLFFEFLEHRILGVGKMVVERQVLQFTRGHLIEGIEVEIFLFRTAEGHSLGRRLPRSHGLLSCFDQDPSRRFVVRGPAEGVNPPFFNGYHRSPRRRRFDGKLSTPDTHVGGFCPDLEGGPGGEHFGKNCPHMEEAEDAFVFSLEVVSAVADDATVLGAQPPNSRDKILF